MMMEHAAMQTASPTALLQLETLADYTPSPRGTTDWLSTLVKKAHSPSIKPQDEDSDTDSGLGM